MMIPTPKNMLQRIENQINTIIEENPTYNKFRGINVREKLSGIIKDKEFDAKQLSDTGRLIFLESLYLNLKTTELLIEADMFGSKEKKLASIQELTLFYEAVKKVIDNEKTRMNQRIEEQDFNEEYGLNSIGEYRFDLVPDQELFSTITGFFDNVALNMIIIPFNDFIPGPQINHNEVQNQIWGRIQGRETTIRGLASDLELTENNKLCIAITLNSCLQMENERRIVLEQEDNDIGVKQSLNQ
jgi:hypothetical protein